MDTINLFPTQIFSHQCDFDLKDLYKKVKDHEQITVSRNISNNGGYQGSNFTDEYFRKKIHQYIPQRPDLKIKNYEFDAWVNVNYPGSSNDPHEHITRGGFLSGILYVKVPKNSGNIVFHDPRNYMHLYSEPMMYYNGGSVTAPYEPSENELLLFPFWLIHSVEENKSNQERVSIAFNIKTVDFQ